MGLFAGVSLITVVQFFAHAINGFTEVMKSKQIHSSQQSPGHQQSPYQQNPTIEDYKEGMQTSQIIQPISI